MSLLEKAWAKVHGDYGKVIEGKQEAAFATLCGKPSINLGFGKDDKVKIEKDALWTQLTEAIERNYLATAGTPKTLPGSEASRGGIIENHSYALLAVHRVKIGQNVYKNLVKLRNPWGKENCGWTGEWSPDHKVWTDKFRKDLGSDPKKEKA